MRRPVHNMSSHRPQPTFHLPNIVRTLWLCIHSLDLHHNHCNVVRLFTALLWYAKTLMGLSHTVQLLLEITGFRSTSTLYTLMTHTLVGTMTRKRGKECRHRHDQRSVVLLLQQQLFIMSKKLRHDLETIIHGDRATLNPSRLLPSDLPTESQSLMMSTRSDAPWTIL